MVFHEVLAANKFSFAGHETFVFRSGWLKKGADALEREPLIFTKDDALVELGIGKNMVRSMRHWCLATQIAEEYSRGPNSRGKSLQLTSIGRRLLSENGWDPYLEDTGALWLLHWLLVSNVAKATTWSLAFTLYPEPELSRDKLFGFLKRQTAQASPPISEGSIQRDIECFFRTYVSSRQSSNTLPEEGLDCPLTELGLIQPLQDEHAYRFTIGPKLSLPAEVFGFALSQFFDAFSQKRQSIALYDCLYGPGSPGQAFKLDENSIVEYVEELERLTSGYFTIDDTAGLKQIYRHGETSSINLLEKYFLKK